MAIVFVCADGQGYLDYPHAPGASDLDFTRQVPLCGSGQGHFMDVASLGVQSPDGSATAAAVTPEQALVQVAIVGVGAVMSLKGFAVGLMR